MPPKKKGQLTLDKFYGYSTMPKSSNADDIPSIPNLNDIPDLNDETNEDVDVDLVDNLEMFGHEEGGCSSERKRKTSWKREF